jgi:hypothetical protein
MSKKYRGIIFAISILFYSYSGGLAYDADIVHPKINETAAKNASLFIATLKNLGFPNGVDSFVNQKEIFRWLREGGIKEDFLSRPLQHFHDPTKTWDKAGLKDSTLGGSSLLWAQNPNQASVTGNWSWPAARTYYYQALTSGDNTVRQQNFADTFRALGQVMHLLADVSVPEHTRNDLRIIRIKEAAL